VTWDEALPEPPPDFPYFNSFAIQGLSYQSTGFSLNTEDERLHFADSNGTVIRTAAEPIADVDASDFVLSTQLVLHSASGTGNQVTVGIGALGSSSGFLSADGQAFYLADWGVNEHSGQGRLRILALGDDSDFTATEGDSDGTNSNGSSVDFGQTYELRLVGTYAGETLNLTFSVFDAEGDQIGNSATAVDSSPLAGTYFGYRNRIAGADHQLEVSYDHFRLAAPPELLGDFNADGKVNASDYTVWRNNLGTGVNLSGNGNEIGASAGVVDWADYVLWKSQYGQTVSGAGGLAVPEPSLRAFLLVALVGRALTRSGPSQPSCRRCSSSAVR
jgi:hypothetical protein